MYIKILYAVCHLYIIHNLFCHPRHHAYINILYAVCALIIYSSLSQTLQCHAISLLKLFIHGSRLHGAGIEALPDMYNPLHSVYEKKEINKKYFFQEWGEIIETIWPDLTEEDLALWKDVGVTFKMRRRYLKFVLLYYVPRFPYLVCTSISYVF